MQITALVSTYIFTNLLVMHILMISTISKVQSTLLTPKVSILLTPKVSL